MIKKNIFSCLLLVAIIMIGLFFASCQKDELHQAGVTNHKISNPIHRTSYNIPYTDSISLSKFNNDQEIIQYSLARKIAMVEAVGTGFVQEMNWEGHTLSKHPVVIYGFDSKPKYYEFFYKDALGKEVGSVTVMAKRKAATVLQEIRGSVRDYDALYSKAASGSRLIADWAGNMYMGIIGKSGDTPSLVIDPESGETVEGITELDDQEILDEMINVLQDQGQVFNFKLDSIQNNKIREQIASEATMSLDQQIDSLHKALEIEQNERDSFWEVIEEYSDSLLNATDEEITSESKFVGRWWRRVKNMFRDKTTTKYELSAYRKDFDKRGRSYYPAGVSTAWCGPWAMDWIYYVRFNESRYSHFESYAGTMGPIGWISRIAGAKPMFPKEMFTSMALTTNAILVKPFYSTGRWNALDHIRHKKNPIVILTTSGKSMHWKVGYGCYRTGNAWWRNYYFACQDNGSLNIPANNHYHRSSWFMVFVKVYN